jgi:hypothetical protein
MQSIGVKIITVKGRMFWAFVGNCGFITGKNSTAIKLGNFKFILKVLFQL